MRAALPDALFNAPWSVSLGFENHFGSISRCDNQPCRNWGAAPRPWALFGNERPNSLICSDDVEAADSVMFDLLDAEPASDELIIGTTPAGKLIDPNPPNPAYYWIRFIG